MIDNSSTMSNVMWIYDGIVKIKIYGILIYIGPCLFS
jgi:hypothetical protein